MTDAILGTLGIYAGMFVVGVISGFAFIPAEIALAAVVVVAGNLPLAIALAVILAAGQMVAKGILYQGAARAARLRGEPKPDGKIAKAKKLMERWKDRPLALTFVSGAVGIPPLVLFAPLAGVLGIRFRGFMAMGMAGRSVRFVVIAVAALYASH